MLLLLLLFSISSRWWFIVVLSKERETESKKAGKISANICSAYFTYNDIYMYLEKNLKQSQRMLYLLCVIIWKRSSYTLNHVDIQFHLFLYVFFSCCVSFGRKCPSNSWIKINRSDFKCRFRYQPHSKPPFIYSFICLSFDENWNWIHQFII